MWKGELDRARALVEESQAIHERSDDRRERIFGLAQTMGTLGAIARDAGDEQHASELIEQSATMGREVGVPWWESGMLAELAALALNGGRVEEAATRARESLAIADGLHDRAGRIFGVGILACIAAERGQSERAGGSGVRSRTRKLSRRWAAGGAIARHVKLEFEKSPGPNSSAATPRVGR